MRISNSSLATLVTVLLFGLCGILIGWWIGDPGLGAAIGLFLGVLLQAWFAQRLLTSIARRRYRPSTDALPGLWGGLAQAFYALSQEADKSKQHALEVSQRVNELIDALPDAIIIVDKNTNIQWMNKASDSLLGLIPKFDLHRPLVNLIRIPDFQKFILNDDDQTGFEMVSPVDDSLRLTFQMITLSVDERLIIARDVSHIHKAEQMRRDFVANVSHELRTPLTVLSGYLETWEDMADGLPEELRPSLVHMNGQTVRMQQIIEDLLMLSRLDAEPQEATMTDLVDVPAILTMLEQDALILSNEEQHDIHVDIDEKVFVIGDEKELQSVFVNLTSNAIRYTPPKGKIIIKWYKLANGSAVFSVRDTGVGIPKEAVVRLTERFYRVDKNRSRQSGGTGLGLAIVKHVLQRHGAVLEVESEIGVGSEFRCVIPASRIR